MKRLSPLIYGLILIIIHSTNCRRKILLPVAEEALDAVAFAEGRGWGRLALFRGGGGHGAVAARVADEAQAPRIVLLARAPHPPPPLASPRRVRRVRRVRGGVWPRGFRGKFLTDCVTVRWKPDAEKRNQGSDEKMLRRACSTFLPHCLFIRDRSRLFVHQKNLILDSNAKLTIPPRHYWHLTTKKCFLRRKANCLSGRPTFG